MAKEPTSMFGHMMAAAKKVWMAPAMAPVRFFLRATGQALERLIPHGAAEIGSAFYGNGSAYAPPGVTERLTPPRDQELAEHHSSTQDHNATLAAAASRGAGKSHDNTLER